MTALSQQMDLNHSSSKADFAQKLMSSICGEHHLDTGFRDRLDFHYDGLRLPSKNMTIGNIRYGANVEINISNLKAYSISLPFQGKQSLHVHGAKYRSDESCGLIVSNNDLQALSIDRDCQKLQVVIPEQSIQLVLADLLQRPVTSPIIFNPEMQIDSMHLISGWWKSIQNFLQLKSQYAGFVGLQMLSDDYESFLIKALLLSQESNYSAALNELSQSTQPAYILKVKNYIVNHAHTDIRAEDFQAIAGVSKSKLYQEFQQHYGTSPMLYLRDYRLQQVHKVLSRGQQPKISISKLAHDWGFNHLSRFSQAYREAFGESPSETKAKLLV